MGHKLISIEEYMTAYVGCCVSPGIGITVKIKKDMNELQKFANANKCSFNIQNKSEFNTEMEYTGIRVIDEGKYATLSCRARDIMDLP